MIKKTVLGGAILASLISASATASTVAVQPNGEWYQFDVDEFIAQSAGLEWIDGTVDPDRPDYAGDGSPLTFTFNLAVPGTLAVVDGGFAGDEFKVTVNGVDHFTSTALNDTNNSVGTDFDAALANPSYSRLELALAAGSYSVTGLLAKSAQDGGIDIDATVGALKVTPVPLPAAWVLFLAGSSLAGVLSRRRSR